MKEYNKLIRDNIAEIISQNGQKAKVRALNQSEYLKCLDEKLLEEVQEYLQSGSLEEICDILEVLEAIIAAKNIGREEMLRIKEEKALKNGRFADRLFLEYVE